MYNYENTSRGFVVNNEPNVDRYQYEALNGRAEHKRELNGLARKVLESEARLKKEKESKYPDPELIARLERIIAGLEKYRDPNVKLR